VSTTEISPRLFLERGSLEPLTRLVAVRECLERTRFKISSSDSKVFFEGGGMAYCKGPKA
jgi:hypothetical protein